VVVKNAVVHIYSYNESFRARDEGKKQSGCTGLDQEGAVVNAKT